MREYYSYAGSAADAVDVAVVAAAALDAVVGRSCTLSMADL